MYQVECAALKYYNSVISEKCLYVGMIYNNLSTGQCGFRYISNFSRFESFDDEVDITFVKLYLKGIQQQIQNSILNQYHFRIDEFTKIFVNDFRFTNTMKIEVEEDGDYVTNLTKLYENNIDH